MANVVVDEAHVEADGNRAPEVVREGEDAETAGCQAGSSTDDATKSLRSGPRDSCERADTPCTAPRRQPPRAWLRLRSGYDAVRRTKHGPAQIRMASWLLVTTLYFLVVRGISMGGFPYDGEDVWAHGATFEALTALLRYAFILAVLTGVTADRRWRFVVVQRWWVTLPTFVLTGAAASLLSNIEALQHSVADFAQWSAAMAALFSVLAAAVVGVLGYHLRVSWVQKRPRAEFWVYVARNAAICLYYAFTTAMLSGADGSVHSHYHHYLLAFLLGVWCDLDTTPSATTLAACLSLLAQGIAAYGPDEALTDDAPASTSCTFFGGPAPAWANGTAIEVRAPPSWAELGRYNVTLAGCVFPSWGVEANASAILHANNSAIVSL
ncbi:unnamed protein product [Pedinophyceae sp. YPF-701]|nr:unnamed protein product [Pedinophyceae sp. YPF-701]